MEVNVQGMIKNFQPGVRISKEQFTPELQESIVDSYFGIRRESPNPQPSIGPDQVVVSKADYEKMQKEYTDLRTVFTAPGVAENIGQLLGLIPKANPASIQPTTNPNTIAQPNGMIVQPGAQTINQQNQPTPDPGKNETGNWWDEMFNLQPATGQQSAVAGASTNPNEVQQPNATATLENTGIANQPAGNTQPSPANDQLAGYINGLSARAIARNLDPRAVLQFFDGLDFDKQLDLYMLSQGNSIQPNPPANAGNSNPTANVNLAEQSKPSGPVKIDQTLNHFGNPNRDFDRFRV